MKKLPINVPDSLDIYNKEATIILAAKLYEQGKLSCAGGEISWIEKKSFAKLP